MYTEHKIRPPAWVKAWLETRITTENMTKDAMQIWKLVQARLNEDSKQHDVSEESHDDSKAATAEANESAESRRRVTELLDAKLGTFYLLSEP